MLTVIPIPAFEDNYIWLLRNERHAAVVDPGDAGPVLDYLARENLALTAILNTHHHGDHTGGNAELLAAYPVPVYGQQRPALTSVSIAIAEGDRVALPELGLSFAVLGFPGHTSDHVGFYGHGMLFCGDTLFSCGCGKLFEGTPAQMTASMQKILALPDDTLLYSAHEYTLENIAFAKRVEPDNEALLQWEQEALDLREKGLPTLPTSLSQEKQTNPFLRFSEPGLIDAASRHAGRPLGDPVAVFAATRAWRDQY